jgi:HSP20 family protein
MLHKKISFLVVPLITALSLQANDPFNDPFFKDPFGDDIFKEMMQMQRDMDKMFEKMHNRMQQRSTRQINPLGTFQIKSQSQFVDKGDHYAFISSIPESKENQIDIHTQNGVISITAKVVQTQENNTSNSYSSSSTMQMYQQSMPLPVDADEQSVNMKYEDGKLVITVQKKKGTTITPVPQKKDKEQSENNASIQKIKVPDNSSMI